MNATPGGHLQDDWSRPDVVGHGTFVHWNSTFFPGLEITSRAPHVHYYRHHVHDPFEINWIISGVADIAHRDRSWRLDSGDGIMIAPREPHAGGSHGRSPFSFVSLHVPTDLLPAITACCNANLRNLPLIAVRGAVRPLLDALAYRLEQARCPEEQVAALAITLGSFVRDTPGATLMPGRDPAGHPAIHEVRRILDESYEAELSIAELAEAVRLHERYLISLFKTAMGIPPHQYLIARRLEQARRLIDGHQSLCDIAAATGFADQSHLTRHFKRTFGVTPGAYQRDLRH